MVALGVLVGPDYRAILVALRGATGVPCAVSEEDRKFIPVGVTSTVPKGTEQAAQTQEKTGTPDGPAETGTLAVSSIPDGAEVYADGAFVGNAPAPHLS